MLLSLELISILIGAIILTCKPSVKIAPQKRKIWKNQNSNPIANIVKPAYSIKSFRTLDIGMMLTEVSTRLRSGAMIETAWAKTLQHYGLYQSEQKPKQRYRSTGFYDLSQQHRFAPEINTALRTPSGVLGEDGVPRVLREIWQAGKLKRLWWHIPNHLVQALPAAFAVCRLGYCAGAPMAEILDSCARGVTEANEARAARKTALAGPLSSARMLAALPVIGILFGTLMGADVINFLLHSFFGNICLVLGLGFEFAGIIYLRLLVLQAIRDEH